MLSILSPWALSTRRLLSTVPPIGALNINTIAAVISDEIVCYLDVPATARRWHGIDSAILSPMQTGNPGKALGQYRRMAKCKARNDPPLFGPPAQACLLETLPLEKQNPATDAVMDQVCEPPAPEAPHRRAHRSRANLSRTDRARSDFRPILDRFSWTFSSNLSRCSNPLQSRHAFGLCLTYCGQT